jgi:hypothetical protein
MKCKECPVKKKCDANILQICPDDIENSCAASPWNRNIGEARNGELCLIWVINVGVRIASLDKGRGVWVSRQGQLGTHNEYFLEEVNKFATITPPKEA